MNRASRFWLVAALLIALMAGAQVYSALQETQTFDEGVHLMAGYSYLVTGDYRMNVEHPPLGKVLSALPLLALHPRFPIGEPGWEQADSWKLADSFLYHNRVPADEMLFAARAVNILVTALFAAGFAAWTRRRFGGRAALLALFLFTLDANLIAHGRYVTTDLLAAATFFLTVVLWGRFLEHRRRRDLAFAGIALGLALVSKYSMIILVPLLPALYLLAWRKRRERGPGLGRLFKSIAIAGVLAWFVILAAYAPKIDSLRVVYKARRLLYPKRDFGPPPPLLVYLQDDTPVGRLFHWLGRTFQLPAHPWVMGLHGVASHNQGGHHAYLLGRQSDRGFWYYFPVVFAVKTPTAVLLLLFAAVPIAIPRMWRAPFEWCLLAVPAAVYFAFAMSSGINIGMRHLLPVYPPLFVLVSAAVLKHWPAHLAKALPAFVALVCAIQVFELVRIHPYHLSFFNTLSGGPERGPRYLLDSNIDWGQDLKRLRWWIDRNRAEPVCTLYFGRAPMTYYGVSERFVPERPDPNLDCVVAASVTPLNGVYVQPGEYEWLRALHPTGRVGYSIYLFDLRKRK